MSAPRRADRDARHPGGMTSSAPASPDTAASSEQDRAARIDVEYLLKEASAARAYIAIAEASRDAVLARANLRRALRVLHSVDRHLAASHGSVRGLRALHVARDELQRRLEHALERAIRDPRARLS